MLAARQSAGIEKMGFRGHYLFRCRNRPLLRHSDARQNIPLAMIFVPNESSQADSGTALHLQATSQAPPFVRLSARLTGCVHRQFNETVIS